MPTVIENFVLPVLQIVLFPGLLFLAAFGLAAEWVDRKLCAKLQNRVGPPWYQPLADTIKLMGKEEIIPEQSDKKIFTFAPIVALTAVVTSALYIPIWGYKSTLGGFPGDLIVVLYLLTIPTLTFFLAGWYSRSVFSMIGAARCITQVFSYEIPLLLSILAPAVLVTNWQGGFWSFEGMSKFYSDHPLWLLVNLPAFVISIIALLGKLERVPFDIPEAETEIVAGSFTEYGGRLLAIFRLCLDVELVVGASLLAATFVPFGLGFGPVVGFVVYLVKVLAIVALVALLRSIMARLRIDQMINLFWKLVAPAAFAQLLLNLILKGVFLS